MHREEQETMVIDFHSHILPGIDDGSDSVDTTRTLLEDSAQAGIELMVATPHFYGYRRTLEEFLERRARAWEKTKPLLGQDTPYVRLGAEVAFYSGLAELEELDRLCIQGSRVLLLEMPFSPWGEYELDVLTSLALDRGIQVVLAHYERYYELQKDPTIHQRVEELPVYLQINAGTLLSWRRRGHWLDWLEQGQAHLLGSDCHNLTNRAPNLGQARELLRRKVGAQVLEKIDHRGSELLRLL